MQLLHTTTTSYSPPTLPKTCPHVCSQNQERCVATADAVVMTGGETFNFVDSREPVDVCLDIAVEPDLPAEIL